MRPFAQPCLIIYLIIQAAKSLLTAAKIPSWASLLGRTSGSSSKVVLIWRSLKYEAPTHGHETRKTGAAFSNQSVLPYSIHHCCPNNHLFALAARYRLKLWRMLQYPLHCTGYCCLLCTYFVLTNYYFYSNYVSGD